jgi:putative hydroxymethylpyrimidine transport system permease protein
MKYGMATRRWVAPLFVVLALIIGWEVAVWVTGVPVYILPPPHQIGLAIMEHAALFPQHIGMTLAETLIGFIIAIGLGVGFAVWIHFSTLAEKALYPLLVASQAIPLIALSPVLKVWFGYSIWSKVFVVVLWTFFPVTVTLVQGLKRVDPAQLDVLRTMRATRWQLFRLVEWPAALPSLFAGLKMAALFSVVGATVGEWLGAEDGLGVLTRRASQSMQTDLLFAGSVILMGLGVVLFMLVRLVEKKVLFWQHLPEREIEHGQMMKGD